MFRDIFVENGTHFQGFLAKKGPIRAAHSHVLICEYPLRVWKSFYRDDIHPEIQVAQPVCLLCILHQNHQNSHFLVTFELKMSPLINAPFWNISRPRLSTFLHWERVSPLPPSSFSQQNLLHQNLTSLASTIQPRGVLRFELDRGVPLEPQNPYPSLRVILAKKGTHF